MMTAAAMLSRDEERDTRTTRHNNQTLHEWGRRMMVVATGDGRWATDDNSDDDNEGQC